MGLIIRFSARGLQGVIIQICTIGGTSEHQKVQNHKELKCTKNALIVHKIEALNELITIKTII